MEAKSLIIGMLFFSISFIAIAGWYLSSSSLYNLPIPTEFNKTYSKFATFQNVTESSVKSIQGDTFDPSSTLVALTKGTLGFINILFSIPTLILPDILFNLSKEYNIPLWIPNFIAYSLFISIIIIALVLINKVVPKDD